MRGFSIKGIPYESDTCMYMQHCQGCNQCTYWMLLAGAAVIDKIAQLYNPFLYILLKEGQSIWLKHMISCLSLCTHLFILVFLADSLRTWLALFRTIQKKNFPSKLIKSIKVTTEYSSMLWNSIIETPSYLRDIPKSKLQHCHWNEDISTVAISSARTPWSWSYINTTACTLPNINQVLFYRHGNLKVL